MDQPTRTTTWPAGMVLVAGLLLLGSVAAQRLFALVELMSTRGVPFLDSTGLTIFQVQPLEPLEILIGAALIALASSNDVRSLTWIKRGLVLAAILAAWSALAGLMVLFQGARLSGHVQVPLQGRTGGWGRAALSLRLTSQTLSPSVIALAISILGLVKKRKQPHPQGEAPPA
ncbi:MAG: hypothetical protein ABR507_09990 [Actinomycetota bacterium]